MFKKLKEFIFGEPPFELEHAFFGKILFMGRDQPADDDYWEADMTIPEVKEDIGILIFASKDGPTDVHINFYNNIVSDLDNLFSMCWPIFEPDFEQWTHKKFSGQWRDDFELIGFDIPKDADAKNEWSVCYFVDASNHYFTAKFIDGVPKHNEIDG